MIPLLLRLGLSFEETAKELGLSLEEIQQEMQKQPQSKDT
jgi:predicted transposase YdaD